MRETGVLRKRVDGEEAAPYMGFARTLLGAVKNQMSFGGLLQGTGTKTLPDGTTIRVQSIFGQDTIAITKPVAQVPGQPQEQRPTIEVPQEIPAAPQAVVPNEPVRGILFALCGSYIYNNAGFRPFMWRRDKGIMDIGLGFGRASAISDDGGMVVGATQDASPGTSAIAWTSSTGTRRIAGSGTFAYSVSRNRVVVGQDGGDAASNTRPATAFIWSQSAGLQLIAASAGMFTGTGIRPRISANGSFVCWAGASGLVNAQVLAVRTGEVIGAPDNVAGWGYAVGVADDGTVAIFSEPCYLWNCQTGLITEIPTAMFQIYAISADGSVVVGIDASSFGLVWNAASGIQVGNNKALFSVSRDGVFVGGSINLGDHKDTAAFWRRSQAGLEQTLIPSEYGGEVNGIAVGNPPDPAELVAGIASA